jgi:hypothetical protein
MTCDPSRVLEKSFEFVSFVHEGRDLNFDAHLVARNAISQQFGRRVWLIEPPEFVSLFQSDE